LTKLGLTVLRFTNLDVESNLNSVGEKIIETIKNADSTNDHYKEWRCADSLRKGDILFFGIECKPVEITNLHYEETEEDVFDLEVEDAHSFITEVCAVHNCGSVQLHLWQSNGGAGGFVRRWQPDQANHSYVDAHRLAGFE